jgi:hypothetical protein
MLLPDVNVWLAMTFAVHVHHLAAKAWFDQVVDSQCAFCRLTQQAFLRLASNPAVFGPQAVTLAESWRLYDLLSSDPRVTFSAEPAGIEFLWRANTRRRTYSPKVWNDAYLAAFAQAAAIEIVTFDKGFAQFKNVPCTILS